MIVQDKIVIPDNALSVSKINGLSDVLLTKSSVLAVNDLAVLVNTKSSKEDLNNTNISLSYASQSLINVNTELSSLTNVVSTKQDIITPTTQLSCESLTVLGSSGATTLKIGSEATYFHH